MKRLTILGYFIIFSTSILGQTFRNYKVVFGTGLQVKPIYFLEKKEIRNTLFESIKPSVLLELPIVSKLSLGMTYSLNTYKHRLETYIDLSKSNDGYSSYEDVVNYTSDLKTTFRTMDFQLRLYNASAGYSAPWGRFLYYGIFNTKFQSILKNNIIKGVDIYGDSIQAEILAPRIESNKYWGLSLGFGKKQFFNGLKRTYIEWSFSYKILFNAFADDLSYSGSGIFPNIESTALRKFQNGSIYNLNLIYGISF